MIIVFRIILGVAWVIFNFHVGEHEGKTITKKQLTKEEKKYIDFLQLYAFISSTLIMIMIMCIIEN